MIFVTVGTHEQQFNRLIKKIDLMIEEGKINQEVIIQSGFSDYEAKNCVCKKLISFEEMDNYINEADIIITHGGPASFIAPLRIGKIPIVVPRQKEYNEHVNNHQLIFAKEIENRLGNILVAENDEMLENYILNYDKIVKKMKKSIVSNTNNFNVELEKIVNDLFGE